MITARVRLNDARAGPVGTILVSLKPAVRSKSAYSAAVRSRPRATASMCRSSHCRSSLIRSGSNQLHHQQTGVRGHRGAATTQDRQILRVIPIVQV